MGFKKISIIGRCEYEKTCKILVELFDEAAQQYQALTKSSVTVPPNSGSNSSGGNGVSGSGAAGGGGSGGSGSGGSGATTSSNIELIVKEGQLTWLVYIIGAVIGGRMSYSYGGNSEEHDMYDGELVVRVLQLMNFINQRLEQTNGHSCCEKLDLAMLNFFEQFRKIFIGDQVQKSSKVYRRMSELLGIQDETMWLNVVTSKM